MGRQRVFVTGATGFVGSRLIECLRDDGHSVTAAVRRSVNVGVPVFQMGDLSEEQEWSSALVGQDVIVHCAARVHMMSETAADPLAAFREVNVGATLNLARQAAAAGVRRLIFLSSIKVNGELTEPGRPFTSHDSPAPADPYAVSKVEAEAGLVELARQTGMELVIIRPVLVYGPGVKGNFQRMMDRVQRGGVLPLGAVDNRRSLVALDNLVDLIVTCVDHPAAAGQIFLVSDGEDISTPEMLRHMGRVLGRQVRLLPVPVSWLKMGAALLGKRSEAQRLCGSLQVDIEHTCKTLDWKPPVSLEQGFRAAAMTAE